MNKTIINAVSATTSAVENVQNLDNITLQFVATGISSGNGVMTVLVSNDGTNFVAYNMLIDNVTNTNGQQLTRVASKTLSSNTSVVVALDNFSWNMIKVTVTFTTDGSYSVILNGNKKLNK